MKPQTGASISNKQDINSQLQKYTLLAVMLGSFLTPFNGSAVNLAIPAIGRELGASAVQLGWVATAFLLASAAFLVPFGRAADLLGRKKVFATGLTLFGLTSLACALSHTIGMLLISRALQGAASAMMFGTGMAMLTSVYPPQQRGRVLGLSVSTTYLGLSLGPVLGGFLSYQLGWRSIFYFTALLALVAAAVALLKVRQEWRGAENEPYDWAGAALYVAGMLLFMYGFSALKTAPQARYSLLVGALLLVLFVRQEVQTPYPVLHMQLLLKNRLFAFSNLAALINYSATFAVSFLLSLYLQVIRGYDSRTAGFILLCQPVMMALLSPYAGRLSDRVAPRLLASLGMGLTAAGLLLFAFLTPATPPVLVMANLVLLGTGFALFSSPNSNAVMGAVERRFYGIASSMLGTMRLTGQAISMAVATLLIDIFIGHARLSATLAKPLLSSLRLAFVIFAATCVLGVLASLARGPGGEQAGRV
ncbi:MFS transporter [Desulfurispora thermophila]|uniref:MFS transporter n=1 Tax=Desulfurispora thermophila TaxID=265470 RepID=UPI00036375B4|nr:MFS transporter [Desulfurispora thermophila]